MSRKPDTTLAEAFATAPGWLRRWGVYGWLAIGAVVLAVGLWWVYDFASSVTVPLVVAMVLGILFAPVVDALARIRVPRAIGATMVLALLVFVVVAVVWITVAGVIDQGEVIAEQVIAGAEHLIESFPALSFESLSTGDIGSRIVSSVQSVLSQGFGYLSTGLSGTFAFLFGAFIGAFMLFFILADWDGISGWLVRHLGYPADLGAGILADGVSAMRAYFASVTVTGIIVAIVVGVAMWILDLPLVFSVALITWLTCYIPYAGALISGGFAVFVALGSGGVTDAIVILVVILIAQNVIQTIVQNQLASGSLDIHPLATLIATLLGGLIAGLLGTMLAPAVLAFSLRAKRRVLLWEQRAGEAAPVEVDPGSGSLDPDGPRVVD